MKKYSLKNRSAILESLFLTAFFLLMGYFLNPKDPAFLRDGFNIFLFLLAVLALFYGWVGFISFLTLYGAFLLYFYHPFPVLDFLESVAFGLLLFFFHFVWDREIKKSKAKEEYLERKLLENSIAFYTLKASYDKLERSLLLKPFGMKEALWKVLAFIKEPKIAKEEFLKFLEDNYFVEKASIFENIEKSADPLVKEAMKRKVCVYVDIKSKEILKSYLAVIPVFIGEKSYFLAIEKIYFNRFDKNTLLEIAVIFTYFIQTLEKELFVKEKECFRNYLNRDFAYELCKLADIYRTYKITSSILTFKSNDFKYMKNLYLKIKSQKRVIDMLQAMKIKNRDYLIILMLPFSDKKDAENFLSRIKDLNLKEIAYRIEDLKTYRLQNLSD